MSTYESSQDATLEINGKPVKILRVEIHGIRNLEAPGESDGNLTIDNLNAEMVGVFLRPESGPMERVEHYPLHGPAQDYADELAKHFGWIIFDSLAPMPAHDVTQLPATAWQRTCRVGDLVWLEDATHKGEMSGYYRIADIKGGTIRSYDTQVTLVCPLGAITVPARELAP